MMRHPQREELRKKLLSFFDFPPESLEPEHIDDFADRAVIVYEPDSKARITFTWSITVQASHPIQRTTRMQLIWPRFGEHERNLARQIGLPLPLSTVELSPLFPKDPPPPDVTVCEISDADQATELCHTVLERVFVCPPERWLRITGIREKQTPAADVSNEGDLLTQPTAQVGDYDGACDSQKDSRKTDYD
jgi:hypothetical protein